MWSTGRSVDRASGRTVGRWSVARARSIVFLPSRSSIASSIEGHGRRHDVRGSETRAGLRGVAPSDCVGAHNFVRGRLDNDNVEGSACRNESRDHFLRFAPCARGILGENITLSALLHFFPHLPTFFIFAAFGRFALAYKGWPFQRVGRSYNPSASRPYVEIIFTFYQIE